MKKDQTYKSFGFLLLIVLNVTLGALGIGYKLCEMNRAQINMKYIYQWSSSEENFYFAAITSLFFLGCSVGCFISGKYLLTHFGRRQNLIIADLSLIVGDLLMLIFSLNGFPQLLGRFICGIASGVNNSVIPTYISEIAPTKIRGELCSYFNTISLVGIFISYLVSVGLPGEETLKTDVSNGFWRFVFFFTIITSVIRMSMLLFYFNFEPAPYLLQENRKKEALEVIKKIYKAPFVESIYLEYQSGLEKENSSKTTYSQLFHGKYKSRVYLGIMLFLIQTFSGTNAVVLYAPILFGRNGAVSDIYQNIFFLLITGILLLGSDLSGKVVDNYGRKLLLRWGCIICFLQQLSIYILLSISDEKKQNSLIELLMKAIVLSFLFIYGLTLSPVCWILAAEILNDKGISICGISAWTSNFVLGFLFPFAISCSFIRIKGTFLIFSVCLLFGYFYISRYVKETKGKTPEEVDELYKNSGQILINNEEKIVKIHSSTSKKMDIELTPL